MDRSRSRFFPRFAIPVRRRKPVACTRRNGRDFGCDPVRSVGSYRGAVIDPDRSVVQRDICRGRLAAAAHERAGPRPTRVGLLQAVHEVGQFDISGSVITVGAKMRVTPPKVFLTVIQEDGSFKAVDPAVMLRRRDGAGTRRVRLLGLVE